MRKISILSIFLLWGNSALAFITYPYPLFEKITREALCKVDLRIGTVEAAEIAKTAVPALKLTLDFGPELNQSRFKGKKKERQTSAQLADRYTFASDPRPNVAELESILGRQVVTAINFAPKQVGKVMSRFLVLGVVFEEESAGGTIYLKPGKEVQNGSRVMLVKCEDIHRLGNWREGYVDPVRTLMTTDLRVHENGQGLCIRAENLSDDANLGHLVVYSDDGELINVMPERDCDLNSLVR